MKAIRRTSRIVTFLYFMGILMLWCASCADQSNSSYTDEESENSIQNIAMAKDLIATSIMEVTPFANTSNQVETHYLTTKDAELVVPVTGTVFSVFENPEDYANSDFEIHFHFSYQGVKYTLIIDHVYFGDNSFTEGQSVTAGESLGIAGYWNADPTNYSRYETHLKLRNDDDTVSGNVCVKRAMEVATYESIEAVITGGSLCSNDDEL